MKTRSRLLATALPAAVLLASLSSARAADPTIFSRIAPPAGAALTGLADVTPMRIVLSLPLSDPEGASRFAQSVSNPASVNYGHYLTPSQYAARFGADSRAYEALRNWAAQNGLEVGRRTTSRATVSLKGTAGQFAALFQTRFAGFNTARGDGRVMVVTPTLPAALAGKVDGVIGLENAGSGAWLVKPRTAQMPKTDVGTGVDGYYSPSDIRTAYNVPAQTNAAQTEVFAVFEQGGYTPSDVTTYNAQYKLPNVPITLVSVNNSPTSVNNPQVELEAELDVDAATAMNPALKQILMYIDSYLQDSFQTALVDTFAQVADDDQATVFSISYGQDENQQGVAAIRAENKGLMQLQAEGITVLASSGDDGAAGREGTGLNVSDPGAQPRLTSVGGTTLIVNNNETYHSEGVWNDLAINSGATGGGVSEVWKIPAWQIKHGTSVAVANGGSATMRNMPDVAAVADPLTPWSIYCADFGGWTGVGGTSLSTPLWGGMLSIANADRVNGGKARLGFFNPLLYQLGYNGAGFHDITMGNNGTPGYSAGPGYDNDTGWGSTNLRVLLPKLLR